MLNTVADYEEYLRLLLDAIVAGRIEARQARELTPEQHAEYKAKLVADEKAEIERGKAIDGAN